MSERKELIHSLKHNYNANKGYSTFFPGFIIGVIISQRVKTFLYEPTYASKILYLYRTLGYNIQWISYWIYFPLLGIFIIIKELEEKIDDRRFM